MFGFGKKTTTEKSGGIFDKLKEKLARTRATLSDGLSRLFLVRRPISQEVLDELEERLLLADVGVEATQSILEDLRIRQKRQTLADTEALYRALRENLVSLLAPVALPLVLPEKTRPFVVLLVGVNGSGKTTTIGKLAFLMKQTGHSVLLAAGDTFRAAAVEQLQAWGERNNVPVISQGRTSDAASVVYDAFQSAQARHIDLLIADTAGRLHNKSGLMEELKKVKRVLSKLDPTAPHEVLLVLDATIGQNALAQAEQFHQAIGVTGLVLTKLDGTAKGGILFAIAKRLHLPIRFIGVGEGLEDLRPFSAEELVDALLEPPKTED